MLGMINSCIGKSTLSKEEKKGTKNLEEWYVVWEYEEPTTQRSSSEPHITFSPCPQVRLRGRPAAAGEGSSSSGSGSTNQQMSGEFTFFRFTSNVRTTGRGRLMGEIGDTSGGFSQGEFSPVPRENAAIKRIYFVRVLEPVTILNLDLKITGKLEGKYLTKVVGWCHDHSSSSFSLVSEPMSNGTLHSQLAGATPLPWDVRYRIVCGVARAILYLHEEFELSTLHVDITSRNVLLDDGFNAKLLNLGALWLEAGDVRGEALVLGTSTGNPCAPKLVKEPLSREANVCSFGNVVLEVVCGLKEKGEDPWRFAMEAYAKGAVADAVDGRLEGGFNVPEAERVMLVGILCAQPDPKERPSMKQAVKYLTFQDPLPSQPPSAAISAFLGTCSYQAAAGASSSSRPPVGERAREEMDRQPRRRRPREPLKGYEVEIVKGVAVGLQQSVQTDLRFERTAEVVGRYTQVLAAVGIPTENWDSLVQEVLRAARVVDGFREEFGEPDYDPTGRETASVGADVERCSRRIEECEGERELLRRRRAGLQERLAGVRAEMEEVERELKAVAARKRRGVTERERRRRDLGALESTRSLLSSDNSSFSCEV